MPKYKSRLSTKKTAKKKTQKVVKKEELVESKPKKTTPKGGSLPEWEHIFHKNPENLIHFLQLAPQPAKVFKFLKEVSGQKVGKKNKYFPKFAKKLDRTHEHFDPYHDIHKNAKNMNHLTEALENEVQEEGKGGSLWNSIMGGIKHGMDWVGHVKDKALDTINEIPGVSKIEEYANKGMQYLKPIAQGVDLLAEMNGTPLNISTYVNGADTVLKTITPKAKKALKKVGKKVDEVKNTIADKVHDFAPKYQQVYDPNEVEVEI